MTEELSTQTLILLDSFNRLGRAADLQVAVLERQKSQMEIVGRVFTGTAFTLDALNIMTQVLASGFANLANIMDIPRLALFDFQDRLVDLSNRSAVLEGKFGESIAEQDKMIKSLGVRVKEEKKLSVKETFKKSIKEFGKGVKTGLLAPIKAIPIKLGATFAKPVMKLANSFLGILEPLVDFIEFALGPVFMIAGEAAASFSEALFGNEDQVKALTDQMKIVNEAVGPAMAELGRAIGQVIRNIDPVVWELLAAAISGLANMITGILKFFGVKIEEAVEEEAGGEVPLGAGFVGGGFGPGAIDVSPEAIARFQNITINVQGSVVTESDLRRSIQEGSTL